MTIGDAWSDRLSEYLDGELSAPERRALERHLQECASCNASLEALRAIVARLSTDPVTAGDQPTRREWRAIRRSLRGARRRWVVPVTIAASLAAFAAVGGLVSLRGPQGRGATGSRAAAPPAAVYRQASLDL